MKKIMVAIDGSDAADRALEAACGLAQHVGAEIVLVNVEQGFPAQDTDSGNRSDNPAIDEILYAASARLLARAEQRARASGISALRTHSGLGDPAGYILEFAKAEAPDLIVAGRRGRGPLAGLLLGSVSQKLASLASCKVLVVP
jgi:nucleotide-binding universal stress UspA family protein